MFSNRIVASSGFALLLTALAGCGGSGGSDAPGTTLNTPLATDQTTVGQITGFGSVYVNGIEFDTAGASYEVDDALASDDDALAVGMVVKVEGSVNADGLTGTAFSVSYDDDIEGVVEDLTATDDADIKTFLVMDVSDYGPDNRLYATYIEEQGADDNEYEAKGTVSDWDGSETFVLNMRGGATLNVQLDPNGARIPDAGIEDTQFVEVEGTIEDPAAAERTLIASKVELEDDDRLDDDDNEVEVKGMLNYDTASGTWFVKDIALTFDGGTEYEPLSLESMLADQSAAGLYVEVEGEHVGDVLQVEEIELEEDELGFKAVVAGKSGGDTLTLSFGDARGTVDVIVNNETMFRDDDVVQSIDYGSINELDKVEIDARWGDDGAIYASNLHLEDGSDYEIEGPVEAVGDRTLQVLGVVYDTDPTITVFEDGIPVDGDFVEVEDETGDGMADTVEIED
jgi:hypothetical protein